MRVRIDPADTAFSLCVRERTNWTCEYCGKSYPRNAGGLQCSHLFSRRHMATRYTALNAFAHCFSCHQKLGGDPVAFTRWAEEKLGPAKVESLHRQAWTTKKLSKEDKKFIAAHYRQQHKSMVEKRQAGYNGYLAFAGWEDA